MVRDGFMFLHEQLTVYCRLEHGIKWLFCEVEVMDDRNLEEFINTGAEITGALIGGSIGFFAGGPLLAGIAGAGGVVVTKGLAKIGTELKQRVLGKREEVRIGASIYYTMETIQSNLQHGKRLRTDDFFISQINSRSDADEVYEGVMLSAQREHEEKKLTYLGKMLGNIVFRDDIDKCFANY